MTDSMLALVYEAPYQMHVRQVPVPHIAPDEVLIRVAYSGICGSELSGYEGKNSLRKPPLIMGHEFSGLLEQIGTQVQRPELSVGAPVTANPLLSCHACNYCVSGREHLCPKRKLLSASLPGSNAQYVAVRADAVSVLPEDFSLAYAALTEPAACAVHTARLAAPAPGETGLVVGAGPIGLLIIQALKLRGMKTVYCADLNAERLDMATALGATPLDLRDRPSEIVDVAIDAVGVTAARQACVAATRAGGRVVWIGLHEGESLLPVNDMIRREIASLGSFTYTRQDFQNALDALIGQRIRLDDAWTRVEPLAAGTACFEELMHGASVAKIWLTPPN